MHELRLGLWIVLAVVVAGCASDPRLVDDQPRLSVVASFPDLQITGVAVSREGRIFVNAPRWDSNLGEPGVFEVLSGGETRPYPNEAWNDWQPGDTASAPEKFVCVQSVWIDRNNDLWILDPASPNQEGVVEGGAKLVKVSLRSDEVTQVIRFDASIAPRDSYLNDVRVDPWRNYAYITDSGAGALVVVDLDQERSRRVLEGHASTQAERNVVPVIGGRELRDRQGQAPRVHADGIALSRDGRWLFYHALVGRTLYRLPTTVLRDFGSLPSEVAQAVRPVAETVVTDGLAMDADGRVYHTALERNAILAYDIERDRLSTVVRSSAILWPDSIALGFDGDLYFTTSQIHLTPRFAQGRDLRTEPHRVFRVRRR